ncbi:MAG TPA: hypothetical protein VGS16_12095 [Candidatus Dormibacteraeota bacterium]|nr:hypothetical protein [Candidatus Dormibacteraeota bacterium]
MKAFLLGAVVLLCSCMPGQHAGPQGTTVSVKGVVLQAQDLSAVQKCPQSDKWAGLLLSGQPEMLPTGMATWSTLQSAGATDGWMSLYADDVAECPLLLGNAIPKGRLVYTAAIKFKSSSSAAADFTSDSQNFPVAPDFSARFAAAGGMLTRGASTGLGDNSVVATITLRGVPTYVVFWQNKSFEAVVYASNVSTSEGNSAATHMNDRIH